MTLARILILILAATPFIYYLLAVYSSIHFFRAARRRVSPPGEFTVPVSILKPVRGLDPDAYENFASYCYQDYPEYEILFCVSGHDDPAAPVIEKLIRDCPERQIRILYGSGRNAINDKVAKLVRLVAEAKHHVFVINDADVRVEPDYLRSVVAPLRDPTVGGATCLYVSTEETTFLQRLQSIGMSSDFFPGIFVAWQLDGVKFAFGQTIVTRRKCIEAFGGYEVIENRPADDLLVGRMVTEKGYRFELVPYVVKTVADFETMQDLLYKRVRWMTVMRHMRPWGHFGLVFTQGLPWAISAAAVHPSLAWIAAYLGGYLGFRIAMTIFVGRLTLRQRGVWKRLPLIPVWDALAFLIWVASFTRKSIRWRGVDYLVHHGMLAPVASSASSGGTARRK